MSDLDEGYAVEVEEGLDEFRSALFEDTIRRLEPDEAVVAGESLSVKEAVARMMAARRAAVLIVDDGGRLSGIFTERDVLTRVVAAGLDPESTRLAQVMTRGPEALAVADRVAYAVNRMSVAGYRTIPLVDGEQRPIGVVTVNHIIRWMATLFPEAVLNLRPGDLIKRPSQVDAG
jgi:CBS domain-containing protein